MTKEKTLPIFIRDTREHKGHGFKWRSCKKWGKMETAMLKYGDYSIKGFETSFAVERKGSASEFIGNLITNDKKRFHKELEVLSTYKSAWIVCEFNVADLRKAIFYIPKRKRKYFSMNKILGAISSIICKYKIPVIFAGNNKDAKILSQKLLLKAMKYSK
jgi:ERCC4-type nuclease